MERYKPGGGYIVDKEYINETPHLKNVISWDSFLDSIEPNECEIFIAIGYNRMNSIREEIYNKVKQAGYNVGTFIHQSAIISNNAEIGEGSIILEKAIIQPYVKCGVCNIIWSNVNICHHSYLGNFNFLAASSVVLGRVKIGNNCFIGSNSTIKNEISILDRTLIGAGAYCRKDTEKDEVVVLASSITLNKRSDEMYI